MCNRPASSFKQGSSSSFSQAVVEVPRIERQHLDIFVQLNARLACTFCIRFYIHFVSLISFVANNA